MLGVDYVPASVQLASAVAAAAGFPQLAFQARFAARGAGARLTCVQVDDVLDSVLPAACADLVVDKGTWDAVGLAADGEVARGRYRASLTRLLRPGALFVITSCNATADELLAEFSGATLAEVDRVRTYPVFRFGGHEGSRVATLAFRRL